MSGSGAPGITTPSASHLRVAIVAASWHQQVMDGLIEGAKRTLKEAGVEYCLIRVPGSFELPVAASRLVADHDGVVALGVVIRGGTPHFDYVCSGTTTGLINVSVGSGKPVGFGVLTCDTEQQALDRAGLPGSSEDKGAEAASAVIMTVLALAEHGGAHAR